LQRKRWPEVHARNHRKRSWTANARGYSLIELMTALTVLAILAKIAMPHFDARRVDVITAQRIAIANLRIARSNAITKSIHYQITIPTTTTIKMTRMIESPAGSGTWIADAAFTPQTITVPAGTQFKSASVSTTIEFNSRGLATGLNAVKQLDVQDSFSVTKSLQVWPSGQVNEI
jgi:prepilin-type N-terminal cleavage/methylation domain-containing protein